MQLLNTSSHFGWVTIVLHWLLAGVVIGQFAFGWYMTSLDYYDPLYKVLPHFHKSIGSIFAALLLGRIGWTLFTPSPSPAAGVPNWQHRVAVGVQWILLGLLLVVVGSGYLMATAEGRAVAVFNWFDLPAMITTLENQAAWAGTVHHFSTKVMMGLAGLHAVAALKHHFIDRNATLLRMLGRGRG